MKIPKTKDGEHILLFPQEAQGRIRYLNRAIEGRLIWEALLKLRNNSELVTKLDSKANHDGKYWHNLFFTAYDVLSDPEGIFKNVSMPLSGTIQVNEKYLIDGKGRVIRPEFSEEDCIEGDEIKKPYGSCLMYRGKGIWNQDSRNAWTSINKGFDEVIYPNLPNLTLRRISTIDRLFEETIHSNEGLRKLMQNNELIEGLNDLARFFVNNLHQYLTNQGMPDFMYDKQPSYLKNGESNPSVTGFASEKLRKKVWESANALCREYLSEMK